MAKGKAVQLGSGAHTLLLPDNGGEINSIVIINPNDGVVYVKTNGDITSSNTGQWDWKLPSQSMGTFGGPFQSVGLYYVDQSGTGSNAEINVYDSDRKLDIPEIHAIGRAIFNQVTYLDFAETGDPGFPPVGVARQWVDPSGNMMERLYAGLGTAIDNQIITDDVTLGGALSGKLPNPALNPGAAIDVYSSYKYTSTDIWANAALAAGWNNLPGAIGDFNFTLDSLSRYVFLNVDFSAFVSPTSDTTFMWGIFDNGGSLRALSEPKYIITTHGDFIAWRGMICIAGPALNVGNWLSLGPGANILHLKLYSANVQASGTFMRTLSFPIGERLTVDILGI